MLQRREKRFSKLMWLRAPASGRSTFDYLPLNSKADKTPLAGARSHIAHFTIKPYPVRSKPYRVRFALLLHLLALFVCNSFAQETNQLSWNTDEVSAKAEAKKTNKPILIYFTAEWCHYCHEMEDTTLKETEVSSYLKENFILLKADYDTSKALVARYRIRGVPATVVGNPTLETTEQTSGFMPKELFLIWAKQAETAISPEAIAAQKAEEQKYFTDTKRDFRSGLTRQQYQSIRDFFQEVREKQPLALEFAANNLVDEVKHNPARFSRFLKDDKLHIRILVTNAFAELYGNKFPYDPWDQTQANHDRLDAYLEEKNVSSLLEDLIDF